MPPGTEVTGPKDRNGAATVQWGSLLLPPVDRSLERPLFLPLTRDLGRGLEALSGRATIRVRRRPTPESR
jgi:hypothetical protein